MSEKDQDGRRYMLDVARGDARAQYNLALLFDQGRGGLPQDEREAVRLLKLAAEQGLAAAQCGLGAKYAQGGSALAQDDHKAALLFELAADQGDDIRAMRSRRLLRIWPRRRGARRAQGRALVQNRRRQGNSGCAVLSRPHVPAGPRRAAAGCARGRSFVQARRGSRTFRRPSGAQTGTVLAPVWRRADEGRDGPKDEADQQRQRESAERERCRRRATPRRDNGKRPNAFATSGRMRSGVARLKRLSGIARRSSRRRIVGAMKRPAT